MIINFKRLITNTLSIVFFCIAVTACQTNISNEDNKINYLKNKAFDLSNIDKLNNDFSDFDVIKNKVGGAEIVMLGEPNHNSGAAFQAKVKLVKFLHQQMGFNVLVFESGLFECNHTFNLMKIGEIGDTAFAKGVFPIWTESKQFRPLINYIAKNISTENELVFAGFDMQATGNLSMDERLEMLKRHLRNIDSTAKIDEYKNLMNLFENPVDYMQPINYSQIDSTEKAEIIDELKQLTDIFSGVDLSITKNAIYHRFLQNFECFLYFRWGMNTNNITPEIANIRDREMGENLIWLKENIYPNEKLIVWGATSHLLHDRNKLQYPDKMIPMGDYIKKKYGAKSIVLAVTAYEGFMGSHITNSNERLPEASNKSIEYLLHKSGYESSFLDIQTSEFEEMFGSEFTARFLGYTNQKAQWSEMIDGLIFINTMTPNTKNK